MTIELFYVGGCPNHPPTAALLDAILRDLGLEARVREIEVRDADEARALGFPGSPTVRVNGEDIDPEVQGRARTAFGCRLYGRSGTPPREMLERALRAGRGR